MNKNVYINEKIFRFLSLNLIGVTLYFAVSYVSKELTSQSLNVAYKPKQAIEVTQNSPIKKDNYLSQVHLGF